MKVLAVDMGGSRLKLGLSDRPGYWPVVDVHRPPSPEGLTRLVGLALKAHRPDAFAVALPGALRTSGKWKPATPAPGWEGRFGHVDQVGELFTDRGLPAPDVILNDCTALSLGLTDQGTVVQISTGIGARAVEGGEILMDGDKPGLARIREEEFEGRPYMDWVGLRGIQEWAGPEAQGLGYREIAERLQARQIARAAKSWIDRVLEASPEPELFLGGGGALALKPLLEELGVEGHFARDAERPGLEGLARQARK